MRLVLLTLMAPLLAFALEKELSVPTFQVHIRPQLVDIDQDIQQIFLTLPGYPSEVFAAMRLIDQLVSSTYRAQVSCSRQLKNSCMPQIQEALLILRELERLWLRQETRFSSPADAAIGFLTGRQRWLQLMKATSTLRYQLEVTALAISAGRQGNTLTMWQWRKTCDEVNDWLNLLVIEFVPNRLQEDFRSAWMNFFRPLRNQCLLANNRRYLAHNLQSLNFYWNLFNMKLTKRLKKTPEGMIGPLNAIQNRWNQVLRVSFGQ